MNAHPSTRFGPLPETILALAGAALLGAIPPACSAGDAGEPKIYRYADYQGNAENRVLVQNYRFEDRLLVMQIAPSWASFESAEGDFIRLQHEAEAGAAIELRFLRLSSLPEDMAAATNLYSREFATIFPSANILRTSSDERYTPRDSRFPLTYTLASEAKGPLATICTFFIQAPYLYMVKVDIPPRHPKVKKTLIADYASLLQTLQIQPRTKE